MAIFRKSLLAAAGAIFFLGSSAGSEDGENQQDAAPKEIPPPAKTQVVFQPVSPAKLLQWLPACPETWELKKSQGQTLYQNHLESYAMREYRVFRVPGKERTLPTDVMVVTIRDTCGQGPLLKLFDRETAPSTGRDLALGRWGDYPATLVRVGPQKQSLRLLIAGRFIIEMVYAQENNNARAVRPWLSGCNLAAMRAAKQETRPPILKRVVLEFVDELKPDRNRRYSAIATAASDPSQSPAPLDEPPPPDPAEEKPGEKSE